jgi:hypothetical protein
MQKKRAYVAPALAKYGSMKTLTLSSGGSGSDGLGQFPDPATETTLPPQFTTTT